MQPVVQASARSGPPWVRWGLLGSALVLLTAANLSIAVSQLGLGAGLLALLALAVGWRVPPPALGLERPALLLALWALLVVPLSDDPGQSLLFYRRFYLFAAVWVVAAACGDERRHAWLLTALAGGAVAISLYAGVAAWRRNGSLFAERLGEVSNPMTSGALLMLSLLVIAGFLLSGGLGARARRLLALAALPVLVGMVQTMTRSVFLGAPLGLAAMLALARPRRLPGLLTAAVAVPLLLVLLPDGVLPQALARRLDPHYVLGGNSTERRLEMWRGGWEMVRARPWTGVGDHDLKRTAPRYYGGEGTPYYGHLHSNPVMFAVIWGVPGFVLAMAFLLWQPWLLRRRWLALGPAGPPWARGWTLAAFGAWAGFFVAGLTEWYFGDAEAQLLFLAILGAGLGAGATAVARKPEDADVA